MKLGIASAFNYFRKAGIVFSNVDEAYRFFKDMGFEFTRAEFLRYWRQYFDVTARFKAYKQEFKTLFTYWKEFPELFKPKVLPESLVVETPYKYSKPYLAVVKVFFRDYDGEIGEDHISVGFDYLPTESELVRAVANAIGSYSEEYGVAEVMDFDLVEIRKSALFR